MYFAVIDCGTTNSRMHILNEQFKIISKGYKKIGVRDTAINGSNKILKIGLKELFESTLNSAGLKISEVKFAITFGMITSEIGLIEIPHLWAPVTIDDLAKNIKVVQDLEVFPLNIPLYFIRGIKNYFPENTTYKDIRKIDFMRGEETQIAGLLTLYPDISLPLTVVILSSHTKYIHVNQKKQICGSLTTISGQIFEAIKKQTNVGKSIIGPESERNNDYFDIDIIRVAYDSLQNAGFLRSLLMPRFMEVLLKTKWYERELFINSVICADDLKVLNDFKLLDFSLINNSFILIGHKIRCNILSYMLKECYKIKSEIKIISNKEEIDQLSIEGAITIVKKNWKYKGGK